MVKMNNIGNPPKPDERQWSPSGIYNLAAFLLLLAVKKVS